MARIINICGKPSCCPQILEEDGKYKIIDEKEKWETHFMNEDTFKQLGKKIIEIFVK